MVAKARSVDKVIDNKFNEFALPKLINAKIKSAYPTKQIYPVKGVILK